MRESLTTEEKSWLLDLARSTLEARLAKKPLPQPEVPRGPLRELRGAFVTLKIHGSLRGCIGYVIAREPLWLTVRDNVLNAALHDPRFPALTAEELPRTKIEISALTPLEFVDDPSDVEVGRDGLMIERGSARGLLLPQVPVEHGWDRDTFLDQTCHKAGMEPGCWRDQATRILRFRAEVFSEGTI